MPFSTLLNNPDADTVLRSSDNIDFHIDLAILAAASTVFKDMSTFPTPTPHEDGPTIVPLQESSTTLEPLLKLIHPATLPNLRYTTNLDVYRDILKAADKYQMPKVVPILELVLVDPKYFRVDTAEKALHMFAMASQYGAPLLARFAARALLAFPPLHERARIPELAGVSATTYHRLLNYRRYCVEILFSETDAPYASQSSWVEDWWRDRIKVSWDDERPLWAECPHCITYALNRVPQWFCNYVERIKRAYTKKVAVDSVASITLLEITVKSVTRSDVQRCTCHERATANLMKLSNILSQKVERGLAQVSGSTIVLPHRSSPLRSSIESVGKNGQKGDLPHRMTTNPIPASSPSYTYRQHKAARNSKRGKGKGRKLHVMARTTRQHWRRRRVMYIT